MPFNSNNNFTSSPLKVVATLDPFGGPLCAPQSDHSAKHKPNKGHQQERLARLVREIFNCELCLGNWVLVNGICETDTGVLLVEYDVVVMEEVEAEDPVVKVVDVEDVHLANAFEHGGQVARRGDCVLC